MFLFPVTLYLLLFTFSSTFRVRHVGSEFPVELLAMPLAVLGKKTGLGTGIQLLLEGLPEIPVHEIEGLFIMNCHAVFVFNHHWVPLSRPAILWRRSLVGITAASRPDDSIEGKKT